MKRPQWALLAVIAMANASSAEVRAPLARGGKAAFPVVVSHDASPRIRAAADTLAEQLGRIAGGEFTVQPGDGSSGIALGTAASFPQLAGKLAGKLPREPADDERETYLLRSHERGVWLIGTTELAVEHAVWDLLHRLGYRQYFPGPVWEVVPRAPDASLAVDVVERPSYHARSIWYGYGPWDHAKAPYEDWRRKNRATKGIELDTGHAYEGIYARHQDVFAAHPEYLALVDGERKSNKFCISNPALRKLVVDDALDHFANRPEDDSLSVEPSDGLEWCECGECAKLGSPSDRAVLLANEVAAAVTAQRTGKRFGMYAYGGHVAPPKIDVHPRIVVSVATAFGSAGLTLDELMRGWQARGATLGIREYYGVHPWDRDLPGAARGANLDYLARTIPHFHQQGARFFSAESSDNWGPNGLGYYLAARMLWDTGEAAPERVAALRDDFLDRAFGPAREPLDRFYGLIDGSRRPLLSEDLIGRMYRLLDEGHRVVGRASHPSPELDSDRPPGDAAAGGADILPAVRDRLDALVLYTHYVERWFDYSNAKGPERQAAFERLFRHAYRMRGTMMVHTLGLWRDLPTRDKQIRVPPGCEWSVPEPENEWKSSEPFATAEIDKLVSDGIARHKLLDFEPVSFSDDLVPAAPLRLPDVEPGQYGLYFRGDCDFSTWAETAPAAFPFTVKAGLIYGRLGEAKFSLFPRDEPQAQAVARVEIPPDKQPRDATLTTSIRGLQRLHLSDGGDGTSITWPAGAPLTFRCDPAEPAHLHGRWTLYFYVPRGARVIGGFADGPGELRDPAGKTAFTFDNAPAYFSVRVPAGQDGALWRFHHGNGRRLLMTVPPYLARHPAELLLPREVVERDSQRTNSNSP